MSNTETRIIEIVGPAGAGKTTICSALTQQNKNLYLSNFPDVRKRSDMPFFIRNGLQLFFALLKLPRHNSRNLTRREFAWLSILNGWPDVLQKELKAHQTIFLDQGPVYLLSETCGSDPEYLGISDAHDFWQNLYSRWAETLDMIVWLDAEDTDLLHRINSRDKDHLVKHAPDDTIFQFLARYRHSYERTISNLTNQQKNLKILRFNTSQISAEEIVNELLLELSFSQ